MNQLVKGIKSFIKKDEGVAMIEYGLLAALIAVACVATIFTLGGSLNAVFTRISACLVKGATTC